MTIDQVIEAGNNASVGFWEAVFLIPIFVVMAILFISTIISLLVTRSMTKEEGVGKTEFVLTNLIFTIIIACFIGFILSQVLGINEEGRREKAQTTISYSYHGGSNRWRTTEYLRYHAWYLLSNRLFAAELQVHRY
jgi:hypothetical protein